MSLAIELRKVPPDGVRLKGCLAAEEFNLDYQGVLTEGDLKYDLTIEIIGKELLVRGSASIPVGFTCSRCVKPLTRKISIDTFSYSVSTVDREIIDLTGKVREDIIIALPFKPLCREDCKGICPACGKDLNLGPCRCKEKRDDMRWGSLRELKLTPEE